MLIFWSLVRNSVVLAVYLLFSVACFLTVHEHLKLYSNEVEFTGIEQEEIIAILNLIGVLEQKEAANRYDMRGNRVSHGASARKKTGKPAKILQFVRD
jgi:hypothetical protein